MTYPITLEDFCQNISVSPEFDTKFGTKRAMPVGKYKANRKRRFFLMNRLLGSYVPNDVNETHTQFDFLYEKLKTLTTPQERVIFVGFAEAAVGLSQYLYHKAINDTDLNVVYHLQTTREMVDTNDVAITHIDFLEEHSHAKNQRLYIPEDIPMFDKIIFIEDEVTTGKTILNTIKEFETLYPGTTYAVATLLNVQSEAARIQFHELGIKTVDLVSAEIKDVVPEITIDAVETKDFFTDFQSQRFDARLGVSPEEFESFVDKTLSMISVSKDEKNLVLGTEEFMAIPQLVAKELNADVQSTTRSPIVPSAVKDYPVHTAVMLPSAYAPARKTYLYNLKDDYDNVIIVTDTNPNEAFVKAVNLIFADSNVEIVNINQ